MIIYSNKGTTVKYTDNKTAIKTIIRPNNEKEAEVQQIAYTLGVAPKVLRSTFDNFEKKLTIEMEYVNGVTLDNYLKQEKANKQLVKNLLFVALTKLYNRGIDHRDLRGDNILISIDGKRVSLKIIDYGHAKVHNEAVPLKSRDFSVMNNRNW